MLGVVIVLVYISSGYLGYWFQEETREVGEQQMERGMDGLLTLLSVN